MKARPFVSDGYLSHHLDSIETAFALLNRQKVATMKPRSNPNDRPTLKVGDVILGSYGNALPQVIKARKAEDDGWWLTDTCGISDTAFDSISGGWQRIWSAP